MAGTPPAVVVAERADWDSGLAGRLRLEEVVSVESSVACGKSCSAIGASAGWAPGAAEVVEEPAESAVAGGFGSYDTYCIGIGVESDWDVGVAADSANSGDS